MGLRDGHLDLSEHCDWLGPAVEHIQGKTAASSFSSLSLAIIFLQVENTINTQINI